MTIAKLIELLNTLDKNATVEDIYEPFNFREKKNIIQLSLIENVSIDRQSFDSSVYDVNYIDGTINQTYTERIHTELIDNEGL